MTHYDVIKNASPEGMAAVLATLALALMEDTNPEEKKNVYDTMLAFLKTEVAAVSAEK